MQGTRSECSTAAKTCHGLNCSARAFLCTGSPGVVQSIRNRRAAAGTTREANRRSRPRPSATAAARKPTTMALHRLLGTTILLVVGTFTAGIPGAIGGALGDLVVGGRETMGRPAA